MTTIDELPTPALLLDLDVVEANIRKMAERTVELGVGLRPHAKTHKCARVAELQRQAGARGLTVATLAEARHFADRGFHDLTWAFPLIPSRLDEVVALSRRCRLGVVVDSRIALEALAGRAGEWPAGNGEGLHLWLKVDCGYQRAGVDPGSDRAVELAGRLAEASWATFAGILTHAGHAYACRGRDEVIVVARQERDVMVEFAGRLRRHGIEVPEVSVGSTPTMSVVDHLDGVTEIRPGNYVFHDFTQTEIGSCSVADCGVTVLATVVSRRPGAQRCVVDAGALALSRDPGPGRPATMGEIFADLGGGELRRDARLVSLSQEHGIVDAGLEPGTLLRILPNHSCLAVACFDDYRVVRGREVVDRWSIHRAR